MKKIVGVALLLVVALFALPFLFRQSQDPGQTPEPTAQEELTLPASGHPAHPGGATAR